MFKGQDRGIRHVLGADDERARTDGQVLFVGPLLKLTCSEDPSGSIAGHETSTAGSLTRATGEEHASRRNFSDARRVREAHMQFGGEVARCRRQ